MLPMGFHSLEEGPPIWRSLRSLPAAIVLYFHVLTVLWLDLGTDLEHICLHLASPAGSGPTFFWFGGHCVQL